jgi:hypothetical protein
MENFWSVLKRSLHGTYVSVDPQHLTRYIVERAFTFNERAEFRLSAGAEGPSEVLVKDAVKKTLYGVRVTAEGEVLPNEGISAQ